MGQFSNFGEMLKFEWYWFLVKWWKNEFWNFDKKLKSIFVRSNVFIKGDFILVRCSASKAFLRTVFLYLQSIYFMSLNWLNKDTLTFPQRRLCDAETTCVSLQKYSVDLREISSKDEIITSRYMN